MYYIVSKMSADGKFAVLDDNDGVVEWLDKETLVNLAKSGVEIDNVGKAVIGSAGDRYLKKECNKWHVALTKKMIKLPFNKCNFNGKNIFSSAGAILEKDPRGDFGYFKIVGEGGQFMGRYILNQDLIDYDIDGVGVVLCFSSIKGGDLHITTGIPNTVLKMLVDNWHFD